MNIIKKLQWRYATKAFDKNKKIRKSDFEELLEATRLTPTSYGIQLWKALIVKNPEIRNQLREAAHDQAQITDASDLIIFITPKQVTRENISEFIKLVSDTRSVSLESLEGYKKMITGAVSIRSEGEVRDWAAKQAYIALGFLLETAALKNIDSCPMEGFDSKKFDDILGLDKKGYESRVVCPLGYRAKDDEFIKAKKVRFSKEETFEEIK